MSTSYPPPRPFVVIDDAYGYVVPSEGARLMIGDRYGKNFVDVGQLTSFEVREQLMPRAPDMGKPTLTMRIPDDGDKRAKREARKMSGIKGLRS